MRTMNYLDYGIGSSWRALEAANQGRLPRTRAAKALGVNIKAFKAGCKRARYYPNEWHHTGKYGNCTLFYDINELLEDPLFWLGARSAMKAPAIRLKLWENAVDAFRMNKFVPLWELPKCDRNTPRNSKSKKSRITTKK